MAETGSSSRTVISITAANLQQNSWTRKQSMWCDGLVKVQMLWWDLKRAMLKSMSPNVNEANHNYQHYQRPKFLCNDVTDKVIQETIAPIYCCKILNHGIYLVFHRTAWNPVKTFLTWLWMVLQNSNAIKSIDNISPLYILVNLWRTGQIRKLLLWSKNTQFIQ